MTVYAAFLRGVNVGAKNRIPMADLTRLFEAAGLVNVKTVIQSGNIVFDSGEREELLRHTLEDLMASAPDPEQTARLKSLQSDKERCSIAGRDVCLLLGNGIRNSKLADFLQKWPGAAAVRNWKTIQKVSLTAGSGGCL